MEIDSNFMHSTFFEWTHLHSLTLLPFLPFYTCFFFLFFLSLGTSITKKYWFCHRNCYFFFLFPLIILTSLSRIDPALNSRMLVTQRLLHTHIRSGTKTCLQIKGWQKPCSCFPVRPLRPLRPLRPFLLHPLCQVSLARKKHSEEALYLKHTIMLPSDSIW